jgi:hypothetical protein
MSEDVPIDKEKFDTVLRKLIQSKPITGQQIKDTPKLRKDGRSKRHKTVQKTDNQETRTTTE